MNPSTYQIALFLQQQQQQQWQWQAAGVIEAPDANAGMNGKLTFMYHLPYADRHWGRTDAASVTGRLPVEVDFYTFERWPAWLIGILPQGFNRRELCDALGFNADAPSADWPLLLYGAGNPVGNMRIAEAQLALIARRMRWERDNNGSPDWASVAVQVCPDDDELARALRLAMFHFGERLDGLPEVLSEAGVEPAFVQHLETKLRVHRLRLAKLGFSANTRNA